jgi:aminopeptidase N
MEAEAREYPMLLSNGNLMETGLCPNGAHFAVWRDPHPKPCYLFALVAGVFDSIRDRFVTVSGRKIDLAIHTEEGDGPRAMYAMGALKRSMEWDERVFLREYDLAEFHIVAIRDFNGGAMENKSLNIFNSSRVLADIETATDADFEDIERVVAHEYFHNWTGNRITLRDWFQLCLKEGLTVYRDEEFSADQRSRSVRRIKDAETLRESQFTEDAGPLAHPVRPRQYEKIENFYTTTVYRKGAEVVRALETILGHDTFHRGMQRYFERWDGHAITVEDFLRCFEEESGRDLSAFFRWYTQSGTPHLSSRGTYEESTMTYRLTVSQVTPPTPSQDQNQPVTIPLRAGLIDGAGATLTARLHDGEVRSEWVLMLEGEREVFVFHDVAKPPIPALLRGFCAPVVLDDGLSHRERLIQMAHDPDPFTRWDAGQKLLTSAILSGAREMSECDPSIDQLAVAFAHEIERPNADAAFIAMALRIPGLNDLIRAGDASDVEVLFHSRNSVRRRIAAALERLLRRLGEGGGNHAASLSMDQVGRRAVKGAALHLLASLGAAQGSFIAMVFEKSDNMTDTMAALEALSQIEGEWFDAALRAFLERWHGQPRIVDKWFAVQAASSRDDVLRRVRMLASHPLFFLSNPNRVRSLYATFSIANIRAFHASDGSGYRFLAAAIQEIDPLNPHLAARLAKSFESWRRFDAHRQALARAALEEIRARDLSNNLGEIIEKLMR